MLIALNDRNSERSGPLVVVVPDDATLYAVQRLCFAAQQSWNHCLTARYRIEASLPIGTMLSALAADTRAVADGQTARAGDLLDSAEGRHWGSFAQGVVQRAAAWDGVPDLIGSLISAPALAPDAVDAFVSALAGDENQSPILADPPGAGYPSALQGLTAGNRLVLLLDTADADVSAADVAALAGRLTRRMALVLTHRATDDFASSLLRSVATASVIRADASVEEVPRSTRYTYLDSALAADRPAERDELGVEQLALTTARLVLHEGTGPMCVGIEAPWGKGKSTFLNLVEAETKRIAEDRPDGPVATIVRFNAWTYGNAQEAWAGLAIAVLQTIESLQSGWCRFRLRVNYANRFRRGSLVAGGVAGLAATVLAVAVLVLGGRAAVDRVTGPGGVLLAVLTTVVPPIVLATVLVATVLYRLTRPVSTRVSEYLASPDHGSRLGYQHRVIADLAFSLDWFRQQRPTARMVVMVDDLDRCSEDKVVELMQAVNVVLAECQVYTLLAVDGSMVRRAIYRHYRDPAEDKLPEEHRLPPNFSSEYLAKIVQFFIQLPPTSAQNRQAYVARMFAPVDSAPPASVGDLAGSHLPTEDHPADRPADRVFTVNRAALTAPALVSTVPVADTAEEQESMARYQALLDDNPRELKRAVNLHRFVKLALFRSESPPDEDTQRLLAFWVALCLARPEIARDILDRGRDFDVDSDVDLLTQLDTSSGALIEERIGRIDARLRISDLPLLVSASDILRMTTDRRNK